MYVDLWAGNINLNNSIFREGISRTFLRFILRTAWSTIKYREKSRYFFCFRVMLLRIAKVGHRRCTKPDGGLLVERSITTSNASITRRSYGDELGNIYCWLFSRPPALFRRSTPYKSFPTRTSSAVKGERNHLYRSISILLVALLFMFYAKIGIFTSKIKTYKNIFTLL